MKVSAKCSACGSDQFRIPDDFEPDQMVRCASCGIDVGEKQAVLDQLKAAAKKEVGDLFKNTFSKSKHFKIR